MNSRLSLKWVLLWVAVAFLSNVLSAQESLQALTSNPALQKAKTSLKKSALLKDTVIAKASDTLHVPFFDDFSTYVTYPDTAKWVDKLAYINSTFAKNMITIGVATLDAIDANGQVYSDASVANSPADTLTSKAFHFNFKEKDSVYFSFFYQPAGIVDAPDSADMLMVDFYDAALADSNWITVWSKNGSAVKDFKQVMIHVADSFLHDGFRFRFRNLVSIGNSFDEPAKHTNGDIWNIDYVRLDTGRNAGDTVLRDVAVMNPLSSLMTSYTSMPCNHFVTAYLTQLKSSVGLTLRNNDTTTIFVTRTYKFTDRYHPELSTTTIEAGANNIGPDSTQYIAASIISPFGSIDSQTDSAMFDVKAYLSTNQNDFKGNDTVRYTQVFDNYMAHDDGSSEAGWGLLGEGSGSGIVAYKFKAYEKDTLVGVSIYFNSSETNIDTAFYFKLALYSDNKDWPNKITYDMGDESFSPKRTGINQFIDFKLPEPQAINTGNFYIGWIQVSNDSYDSYLNVGFDMNNDNHSNLFYYLNGTWVQSIFSGSLMVRPIFKYMKAQSTATSQAKQTQVKMYPNPASDKVYFEAGKGTPTHATLYDLRGRAILQTSISNNELDISSLPSGLYVLQLSAEKTTFAPLKLLIQH